jgi:hypothetical protein
MTGRSARPRRDGIPAEAGLLQQWSKEGRNCRALADIGDGYATPAIAGARIIHNRGLTTNSQALSVRG